MNEQELIVAIMDGLIVLSSLGVYKVEITIALESLIQSLLVFFKMYMSRDKQIDDGKMYLKLIQQFIHQKLSTFKEYPMVVQYLTFIDDFIAKNYFTPAAHPS